MAHALNLLPGEEARHITQVDRVSGVGYIVLDAPATQAQACEGCCGFGIPGVCSWCEVIREGRDVQVGPYWSDI